MKVTLEQVAKYAGVSGEQLTASLTKGECPNRK